MREQFDDFIRNHQKGIRVALITLVLAILLIAISVMAQRIGKEAVTVQFAPFTAQVNVDGKRVGNNKTVYLKAGTYTFTAELEHFETITKTIEVVEGGTLNFAIGSLIPIDEEGQKIQEARQQDYTDVEATASYIDNTIGGEQREKYPILEFLPDNRGAYSISYEYTNTGTFQVELVLKNDAYIASAVGQLYQYPGINPLDYEIVVRGFEAPFGTFKENTATDLAEYIERGYELDAKGYRILTDRTIEESNYYGVIMVPKDVDLNNDGVLYTPYKMIVQKKANGNFEKVSEASLIFSKLNMGNAPKEFVDKLNKTFAVGEV